MYITAHAHLRATQRFDLTPRHARYEALRARLFGTRWNMAFVHAGRTWCFNRALTTLKTVYAACLPPDLVQWIDAQKERDLLREGMEDMVEHDDDEYGLGEWR